MVIFLNIYSHVLENVEMQGSRDDSYVNVKHQPEQKSSLPVDGGRSHKSEYQQLQGCENNCVSPYTSMKTTYVNYKPDAHDSLNATCT